MARKKKVERERAGKKFGKKMVENEVVDVEPKARKRKPNFSVSEIAIIAEYVGKNLYIIQSKLTNNITNKAKKEMWEEITREVNAVGQASRSVQEVKEVKDKCKKWLKSFFKQSDSLKKDMSNQMVPYQCLKSHTIWLLMSPDVLQGTL